MSAQALLRSILCRSALAAALLLPMAARAFDPPRDTYLMRCGGCHGIEGVSVRAVPALRDQVGTFLCTPEGRAYILHVPNVSMSRIDNDALLASVMNFVAFDLGGVSTPPGAPKFTAAEIHAARADAQVFYGRTGVLVRAAAACAAKVRAGSAAGPG